MKPLNVKAVNLLTILLLFGCSKKTELEAVKKNNWHTYSYKKPNSITLDNINYQEWFFGETTLYRFDSFGAFLSPITYKISNDSLFSFFNKNDFSPSKNKHIVEFIGKIKTINPKCFYLINNNDTLKFYKITSDNVMSQYIIDDTSKKTKFKDSIEKYYRATNKRKKLLHKNLKEQINYLKQG